MANQNVNVTYNPNRTPQIQFSPGTVTVQGGPGTITFTNDPLFAYKSFTATPQGFSPNSNDFSYTIDAQGNMVVSDTDADYGTYNYCVTITVGGVDVTSDPQIINKQ